MLMAAAVMAVTLAGSLPALAQQQHLEAQPSGGAMVVDALVARPLLAVATVGGTAVFWCRCPLPRWVATWGPPPTR